MKNLVSVKWLSDHLNDENIVLLDASQELNEVLIPGSRRFDIKNKFSDTSSDFPNTFPSASQFEEGCRNLGINNESKIIVYDQKGMFASPRVWWMFKTFGHQEIFVLDGGLSAWIDSKFKTTTEEFSRYTIGNFKAFLNSEKVKYHQDIRNNIESKDFQILDARSTGRFDGTSPEPRKGLKSGSIPNSKNLPFGEILQNGLMKSQAELIEVFQNLELEDQPIIFSCGSGITACIILLAAEEAGLSNEKYVYDGSWTEWAELEGLKED